MRLAPGAQITSQARTPEHNAAVGGVADSMHLGAQATDIVLPKGVTAAQLKSQLIAQGYPVTEFLDEGTHVHWGWGPKGGKTGTVAADPWAPATGAAAPNDGHWHNTPQENADLDAFEAAANALPADKTKPSAIWWDTIKAAATSTPARWKQMAGAAIRALGEHPDFLTPSNPNLSAQENEDMNAAFAPARAAAGQQMAQFGTKLYADAAADIKANMPNLDASTAKRLAYTLTSGTIDILPVLAAIAVTKNPVVGGAMMAAQAGTSKYGEARADGRTPGQAAMDASFTGIVNGALGTLPLGALMKPGQTFLAKTLQSAGTFGAISVATEALQLGYDKGLVNQNMTLKEAMGRLEEAGIVGTLQGAFLGGGHAGLESAVNRMHAATPAPQARVEPKAAATVPAPQEAAPAPPQQPTSIQGQMRQALGLEKPGVAPAADPWSPVAEGAAALPASAPAPQAAAVEGPGIPRRALEPDVAVTSSGREVPVQYAVVEASHLVPSQTQEGNPNPAFPAELQPRDRSRAVSQAQIASIAQNINPRLLDRSVNASDGAPIVAPSGVVESGNGRSLAIQRAYADNLPSAQTYRDYLAERGYPVEGMDQPVLVRIRTDAMPAEDRQAFVREANQSGQLGYSATERAMSDATAMPDHSLELFRGGDVEGAANREFVRSFMQHALPTNEHAAMVDTNGNLSLDGARRLRAAMLAKAYADPDLVGSVVENADSSIKAIGNALTDSAPDWALMRAGVARGEIPPALDQTGKLLEAVQLVARARADGRNVAEFVGQPDIFTGQSIDPDTEAWLRLMFRNTKDWTQPVGRDKLAEALQFYAREAQKAQVGQNLLGDQPVTPLEVLSVAKAKQYGEQTSGTSPSLSFGEDVRARRLEGDRSGAEGAAARGGAETAQPGAEGDHLAPFGPAPAAPHLRAVQPGERAVLTGEARDYLKAAGVDPQDRPAAIGSLANLVFQRGRKFGFETLASLDRDGDIHASTDGKRGAVNFSDALEDRLLQRGQRVITIHNHPSNSAFSSGDLAALAYPGHAAMVVVGHDGEWHATSLAARIDSNAKLEKAAGVLAGAQKGARATATKFTDQLYNDRVATPAEADGMLSAITMQSMVRAGLIHYMGPDRIPARFAKDANDVIDRIATAIRLFANSNPDGGVRPAERIAEGADRPARPVQLADGIAQLLGEPGRNAGQSGGDAGARPGAGRPAVYRKPEQLRLLEEENRYERERPPFYSALTRAIEATKMSRAPAKDWAGLIDNLRAKGVKQEEIDWSGVKDWLGQQTGPVTRDQVLQHLRENEVQVQEVQKGGAESAASGQAKMQEMKPAFDEMLQRSGLMGFDTRVEAANGVIAEPGAWEYDTPADSALAHQYSQVVQEWRRSKKDANTKFQSYVLPGGENYRELLLTIPDNKAAGAPPAPITELPGDYHVNFDRMADPAYRYSVIPEGQAHGRPFAGKWESEAVARREAVAHINRETKARWDEDRKAGQFTTGHWDEPNVLAHVRFDDRTITEPGFVVKNTRSGNSSNAFETRAEAESYQAALPESVRGQTDVREVKAGTTKKILHVAEVQSDWHQKGRRRGYQTKNPELRRTDVRPDELRIVEDTHGWRGIRPDGDGGHVGKGVESTEAGAREYLARYLNGRAAEANREVGSQRSQQVPDAPFKSSWHELAIKRLLRYAAEHGYDRLSWDTGETQAARYDLSKQIKELTVHRSDENYALGGTGRDGNRITFPKTFSAQELPDVIGKDMAEKIVNDFNIGRRGQVVYSGLDLKVGGEGMKGFYDDILPKTVNKLAKKWGAKVEQSEIPSGRVGGWQATNDAGQVYRTVYTHGEMTELKNQGFKIRDNPGLKETKPVHSIPITDAMRESVMKGQPLFDESRRYSEEPGAVDARGRALPQTIMPGAEPSAAQLAKAREAAGGGKMGTKTEQKPPGGLFGAQDVPGQDQLSLFEDGRRYAEIPRDDREVLEKAARTGDWIGKYGAEGDTPDARIRNAIAGAFRAWRRSAGAVPAAVRSIFSELPRGFSDVPTTSRPTEAFSAKVKRAADATMDLVHDAQMLIAPMAEGTPEARATAKDFANMMRLARYHGNRMMEGLKKTFSPEQRRKMWEAADEESVLRQKGEATAGRGLSTLAPEERRAVLEQQADAQNVWQAAKDQGMVQGDGLPSYVPRMMVEMGRTGVQRLGSGEDAVRSIPGIGRNLKTKTGQMQHRKYLTAEETEQAGSGKFGTVAAVVRDIQTLPLATMKLREAVAGRALINKIKELGQKTGDDTVVEGHEPTGTPYKWFTMDNPAFKTWRPKLIKNEESGKYEPAKDQNGDIVFEKVPLFVRGDFEGPLRAVLSQDSGKVYNALMGMKGRAMTAIMYSPLIHNAVEWGRALPAMPGKVATFRIYFEGNRAKRDPETMTQAIMHGLVPIGHQAGMQDITSIANADSIKAGRSWTAKIIGAVPGIFSRDAQQAVYRTIDRMGDIWHNTLLWDRVGDLQMGLYTNFRDHLIAKGNTPDAAAYMAAHFANRYAGALPLESMSSMSRKIANLALFSRTYTLGNLGALKDVITGLPRDVQAQIARDGTVEQLKGVRSLAARKALAILATDIALFYAGNSILQSAVSYMAGRQDLSEIEKSYVDRLKDLLSKVTESPMDLLNPFADMQALSATSENEPGRQNRVLVGYDRNGTAIYARNPVGKIGEEFTNWLTSPLETLKAKFSTILRPTWQVLTNDAGFGRQVYDPKAKGVSGLVTNLGHVVSLYLSSQIPLDSLKSAAATLKGDGSEIDSYKALGPMAGVTFSKGAPGGPGVGELYELRRQRDAKQSAAMPGIIEKIRQGDIAGARKDMRAVGISPGLQTYYVRVTQNPRLRLNSRSARELLRQATPEERARILQPTGAQ
jgi:hypothetical protein